MHDGLVGEAGLVKIEALGRPQSHPAQVAEAGAAWQAGYSTAIVTDQHVVGGLPGGLNKRDAASKLETWEY